MEIHYSKSAVKAIESLDRPTKQRIKAAVTAAPESILAWDPDFTKATPAEAREMEQAQKEIEAGETVPHGAINWD